MATIGNITFTHALLRWTSHVGINEPQCLHLAETPGTHRPTQLYLHEPTGHFHYHGPPD